MSIERTSRDCYCESGLSLLKIKEDVNTSGRILTSTQCQEDRKKGRKRKRTQCTVVIRVGKC